ncbi:glycosyltransferase [Vibrio gigantis]|uniref:glycosyltransferase n=1 Tax=Vibrio gigantis TaxID=296199 RepID=UPI001BFD0BE2|nr:glycosyltransferase [Vibrio gigantis]
MNSRINLIGKIPPPYGGVAVSIKSYYDALLLDSDVDVKLYPISKLLYSFLDRPDYIHFNFSKAYKRFLGTVIGRLCGAKVIHTIHGNNLNLKNPFNYFSCLLSHRVLVLNEQLLRSAYLSSISSNTFRLTSPILDSHCDTTSLENKYEITKLKDQYYVLVYANDSVYIDGEEVYGVKFILELLAFFEANNVTVLILDPSSAYKKDISQLNSGSHIYINQMVNFKQLLKKVDLYIRPTSTDGQSIAIIEAISCGVPVLASDSVPRPSSVVTYKYGSLEDFKIIFTQIKASKDSYMSDYSSFNAKDYLSLLED